MDDEPRLEHNQEKSRYELWLGDQRAGTLAYREQPGSVVLISTRVDPKFEGRGFGSRLVARALADARAAGSKVEIECTFAQAYLKRHPEEQDLLVEG
jgi:uncharacterized protein